ncbi:radical SAM protein, partial [candidate division KSB1 bacterium]|nr:radical SAM protein [candidate division KSB1 bacterium]
MSCCNEHASETCSYNTLPEGIPPLRSFYLYLSDGCNLACRHCWITPHFVDGEPDPGQVIDKDALQKAVAEAKSMGLTHAKLTGGEPMLHPRFFEIADMLTEAGLSLDMETNGTLITPENARYLKEKTNLSFVSVSID